MIKKLIGLCFIFPLFLQAQVSVSVQLPPAGLVQRDQLWNLVLVNHSSTPIEVTILLDLQDPATGQSVLRAGTRSVLLSKGIKVLSAQDVQPVQYQYFSASLSSSYLPLGSYLACYSVSTLKGDKVAALGDECTRITIGALSPPLLNTPADRSVVQGGIPQFSWIPPAPFDMFNDLSYDLALVEVKEGQSPLEAILQNTPLYAKHLLRTPYDPYPSTSSRLEGGKVFAWQVTARNGANYAVPTEVWTFRIAKDSAGAETVNSTFIVLKSSGAATGVSYVSGTELRIKYYSFDSEYKAVFRFLSSDRKPMRSVVQKVVYGDNFISLPLNSRFRRGEVYYVELTDKQHNTYSLSFSIK